MKLPLTSHFLQIKMISTLFDFTYTWIFFWTFVIIFVPKGENYWSQTLHLNVSRLKEVITFFHLSWFDFWTFSLIFMPHCSLVSLMKDHKKESKQRSLTVSLTNVKLQQKQSRLWNSCTKWKSGTVQFFLDSLHQRLYKKCIYIVRYY